MNIMNATEILRLSNAVYESDTMAPGQDVDSFREIRDELNPKRYIRFACENTHSKWMDALVQNLGNIGGGAALITTHIAMNGDKFVFADDGHLAKVAIIDLSKVADFDEARALMEIIRQIMVKMRVRELEKELADRDTDRAQVSKMRTGISQIKTAADRAKAGIGSRQVNNLKTVIDQVAKNTK